MLVEMLWGGLVMRDSGPEGTSGIPLCSWLRHDMLVSRKLSISTLSSVEAHTCPVGSAVVETFYGFRDSRGHVAAGQDTDLTMAAEGKLVLIRVITTVTHSFTLHCE